MSAKFILHQPYANAAVCCYEVISHAYCAMIDHRSWPGCLLQVVKNAQIGLCHIPDDISFFGQQNDQRF